MSQGPQGNTRMLRARPVVGLWLLMTLVVAAAAFATRREPVDDLAGRYFAALSTVTVKEVRQLFEPSQNILNEALTQAKRGLLPVDDLDKVAVMVVERLRYEKRLKWLSYSEDATGRFVGARREGDRIILNRSDPKMNGGVPAEVIIDADGTRTPLDTKKPPYDPRNGDWYRQAVMSKGIIWTKPFAFNEGVKGITAAVAFRQPDKNSPQGVFTADFYLDDIAKFLEGLSDSNKNLIYLLDRDGETISTPLSQKEADARPLLQQALTSVKPSLAGLSPDQPARFTFNTHDKNFHASLEVFAVSGDLQWVTAIIVPEEHLLGTASPMARWASRLSLLATVLALLFGALLLAQSLRKKSVRTQVPDSTIPPGRTPPLGPPVLVENEPDPEKAVTSVMGAGAGAQDLPESADDLLLPHVSSQEKMEARARMDEKARRDSKTGMMRAASSGTLRAVDLLHLSRPIEDLSGDRLLAMTPRMDLNGRTVPALAGIPLLARLGQGAMGAVYFGIQPRLKKEVAVKVLSFMLAERQPEWVERFYREGQMAALVQSPFVVNVFDVNEDSGLFFLVMEYVRGMTAGDCVNQVREGGLAGMSEATALDICIAASKGLAAAHDAGVIHRDIKPENILVPRVSNGEDLLYTNAKLSDLGLARSEGPGSSLTATQTIMGTVGFMAPEQARDSKRAGKSADVFSMAATLYTLLGGNTPFTGGTPLDVLMHTVEQPHTPLRDHRPDISDGTVALIDKCLSKDPAQRLQSGAELATMLLRCRQQISAPGDKISSNYTRT